MIRHVRLRWLITIVVLGLPVAAVHGATITIDTVAVGNKSNTADDTGYGAVDHNYNIGKYEVTAGQYTEFLNAVDATGDNTLGLYNSQMNNHSWGCQITWNSDAAKYDFSGRPSGTAAAEWADRPVNFLSFWDAARFANWLHNGQGNGDTESGAYRNIGDQYEFAREDGALFFIPTVHEWYKAAYYDGEAEVYYDYPTGSDTEPGRDMSETTNPGNNANYKDGTDHLIGWPYYRTKVGEFELSDSPYGTFDQGGNVWEWTESRIGKYRRNRGGSHNRDTDTLHASFGEHVTEPLSENANHGFRVAAVPEPSAWILAIAGLIGLLSNRRR